MDCGGHDLALQEATITGLAALRQDRETGAALDQRPLQQRIMAATDDRRRIGRDHAERPGHAREQPAVQIAARKQPLAGDLRARDRSFCHQFVELALLDAQVVGGLGRRQELEPCVWLHFSAQILILDLTEGNTPLQEDQPACEA